MHKTIGKLAICHARSQHRVPFFPTFPYPRKRRHWAATPSRRSTNESPRRGGARVYLHRESYHCSAGIKATASGRRASPRTKPKRNRGPGSPRAKFFFPAAPFLRSSPLLSREFVARSPESQRHLRSLGVEAELSDGFGARRRRFLGRCRGGLRRACGYRLCGAGSGWAPAKGSGSWNRALLRTLEVSVAALVVNFEVLPVFLD